jgi:hypothetical protein
MAKYLPIVACLMFLAPAHKAAAENDIERFTRSIAEVYRISVMCSKIQKFDAEQFARIVVNYLGQYYPEGVPYWALPEVKERIKDRRSCTRLISATLSDYREASSSFVENNPEEPMPPVITFASLAGSERTPSLNVVKPFSN